MSVSTWANLYIVKQKKSLYLMSETCIYTEVFWKGMQETVDCGYHLVVTLKEQSREENCFPLETLLYCFLTKVLLFS